MFQSFNILLPFLRNTKIKTKSFFSPIEQVKHHSPSVKPASQLLYKLGKINLFLITTGFNLILPLVTQILKALTNLANFSCLRGKTILPLNMLIKISISFLLCVIYLLVFKD
jgi:hypothetical protein